MDVLPHVNICQIYIRQKYTNLDRIDFYALLTFLNMVPRDFMDFKKF